MGVMETISFRGAARSGLSDLGASPESIPSGMDSGCLRCARHRADARCWPLLIAVALLIAGVAFSVTGTTT
jgi:hypothetical protein